MITEVHLNIAQGGSGDFIANPHLNNPDLTVTHCDSEKAVRPGHILQAITLEHITNKNRYGFVLGWVPTKTFTPKKKQHKIMCAVFGSEDSGRVIIRDRDVCQLFVEHLNRPFSMISYRACRGAGLVKHAILNGCTAIYTPEGYDDYLLAQLQDAIQKSPNKKLKLFTKMDGGLLEVK